MDFLESFFPRFENGREGMLMWFSSYWCRELVKPLEQICDEGRGVRSRQACEGAGGRFLSESCEGGGTAADPPTHLNPHTCRCASSLSQGGGFALRIKRAKAGRGPPALNPEYVHVRPFHAPYPDKSLVCRYWLSD